MSAMANTTPIVTTITKTTNKEKTMDVAPRVNIQNFCQEHYEDILPIIMENARSDKRKEVQTRLNFGDNSKKTVGKERTQTRRHKVRLRGSVMRNPGTDSRNPSHGRDHSFSTEHPRVEDHRRDMEESYDDTYSQRTKYRNRSRDGDRFRNMKRWRESESPLSRGSESNTSNKGHWKSRTKRQKLVDEDDLAVPWTCEDVDPFTT
ncbi:hypothetical protein Tco_0300238 [Tanacetum coccineum]